MHIHSVDSGGESTCVITTDYYEETDAYCLGELASSSLTVLISEAAMEQYNVRRDR